MNAARSSSSRCSELGRSCGCPGLPPARPTRPAVRWARPSRRAPFEPRWAHIVSWSAFILASRGRARISTRARASRSWDPEEGGPSTCEAAAASVEFVEGAALAMLAAVYLYPLVGVMKSTFDITGRAGSESGAAASRARAGKATDAPVATSAPPGPAPMPVPEWAPGVALVALLAGFVGRKLRLSAERRRAGRLLAPAAAARLAKVESAVTGHSTRLEEVAERSERSATRVRLLRHDALRAITGLQEQGAVHADLLKQLAAEDEALRRDVEGMQDLVVLLEGAVSKQVSVLAEAVKRQRDLEARLDSVPQYPRPPSAPTEEPAAPVAGNGVAKAREEPASGQASGGAAKTLPDLAPAASHGRAAGFPASLLSIFARQPSNGASDSAAGVPEASGRDREAQARLRERPAADAHAQDLEGDLEEDMALDPALAEAEALSGMAVDTRLNHFSSYDAWLDGQASAWRASSASQRGAAEGPGERPRDEVEMGAAGPTAADAVAERGHASAEAEGAQGEDDAGAGVPTREERTAAVREDEAAGSGRAEDRLGAASSSAPAPMRAGELHGAEGRGDRVLFPAARSADCPVYASTTLVIEGGERCSIVGHKDRDDSVLYRFH